MVDDLLVSKKVERNSVVAAIEALRSRGMDVNPSSLAEELSLTVKSVIEDNEIMDLISEARKEANGVGADYERLVAKVRELEDSNAKLQQMAAGFAYGDAGDELRLMQARVDEEIARNRRLEEESRLMKNRNDALLSELSVLRAGSSKTTVEILRPSDAIDSLFVQNADPASLKEELDSLRSRCRFLEQELAASNGGISAAEIERLRQENLELQEFKRTALSAEEQEALSQHLASMTSRQAELYTVVEHLQKENSRLQEGSLLPEQVAKLRQPLEALTADYEQLTARHEELNHEYKTVAEQLEQLKELHQKLTDEHMELKFKVGDEIIEANPDEPAEHARHSSHLVSELQSELTRLKEDHEQLVSQHRELTERYEELTIERDQLKSRLEELSAEQQQRAEDKEYQYQSLVASHDELVASQKELSESHEHLNQRHHELSDLHNGLKDTHEELTRQYEELKDKHQELSIRHEELSREQGEERELANRHAELRVEHGDLQHRFDKVVEELEELRAQKHRLDDEQHENRSRNESLESQIHEFAGKQEDLMQQVEQAHHRVEELEAQLKAVSSEKDELQHFLSEKSSRLDELTEQTAQLDALSHEYSQIRARLDSLHADHEELKRVNEQLKEQFEHQHSADSDLHNRHVALEAQHKDLTNLYLELNEQYKTLNDRYKELTVSHKELSDQHKEESDRQAQLRAKYKELNTKHQELTVQYQDIKEARDHAAENPPASAANEELTAQVAQLQSRLQQADKDRAKLTEQVTALESANQLIAASIQDAWQQGYQSAKLDFARENFVQVANAAAAAEATGTIYTGDQIHDEGLLEDFQNTEFLTSGLFPPETVEEEPERPTYTHHVVTGEHKSYTPPPQPDYLDWQSDDTSHSEPLPVTTGHDIQHTDAGQIHIDPYAHARQQLEQAGYEAAAAGSQNNYHYDPNTGAYYYAGSEGFDPQHQEPHTAVDAQHLSAHEASPQHHGDYSQPHAQQPDYSQNHANYSHQQVDYSQHVDYSHQQVDYSHQQVDYSHQQPDYSHHPDHNQQHADYSPQNMQYSQPHGVVDYSQQSDDYGQTHADYAHHTVDYSGHEADYPDVPYNPYAAMLEQQSGEHGEHDDGNARPQGFTADELHNLVQHRVETREESSKDKSLKKFVGGARNNTQEAHLPALPRNVPPDIRKACLLLGLKPEELTRQGVFNAWKREMAKPGVHPDTGGDTEMATYLNTAKDRLVRYLEETAPKLGKKFGSKDHPPTKK